MTKKVISFLTALSVLSAMPLSAAAETTSEIDSIMATSEQYMDLTNDYIYDEEQDIMYARAFPDYFKSEFNCVSNAFIILTDGTELTEDMIDITDVEVTVSEWDSSQWFKFDTYAEDSLLIPEGEKAYQITLSNWQLNDQYHAFVRDFAIKHDYVSAVYGLCDKQYDVTEWSGSFTVYTGQDVDESVFDDIRELAAMNPSLYSTDIEYGLRRWSVEIASADRRAIYGQYTEKKAYNMHLYIKGIEKALNENYKDLIVAANADFSFTMDIPDMESPTIYKLYSVWTNGGDFDSDGEVNSADAAEMLNYSALSGALATGTLTTTQQDAGDLNGDGIVDAADAANVLVYSAQKGTGHEPDWFDILKS